MSVVYQRLAELWTLNKMRDLTQSELDEVSHCLALNAKYVWEIAYLKNLSLMATMINDSNWLHEVCLDIENLQSNHG